jgi:nonsense-mediated mRNA decay protein 3
MRKCAICGEETEYEICSKCYLERNELFEFRPYIEIRKCSKCGRFFSGKWCEKDIYDAVMDEIMKNFTCDEEFEIKNFEIKEMGENTGILSFDGSFRGEKISFEVPFELRIDYEVCERCSRISGGYYESIIQLRAENRELESEEIQIATTIIQNSIEKEKDNPKAFVSKVVQRKEGIDYYIGDRNLGKKLIRKIEERLGGRIKESKKISGRIDGRDIFRTTYSIKLPEYRMGDVVRDEGRVLIVTNHINKKAVDATGKSFKLKDPELAIKREDIQKTVVVNKDEDVVEVLRPRDQKVVRTKRLTEFNVGDEVLYFEVDGEIYVFPSEVMKDD